jgi:hypothetical protein
LFHNSNPGPPEVCLTNLGEMVRNLP